MSKISIPENICKKCNKSFINIYNLQKHKKNKACRSEETIKYNCIVCDKQFTNMGNVNRHMNNSACGTMVQSDVCSDVSSDECSDVCSDDVSSDDECSDNNLQIDYTEEDKVMISELTKAFTAFKKESKKKEKEIKKLKKDIKLLKVNDTAIITTNSGNGNGNNSNNNNNNTQINITLVGYGQEDVSKIDDKKILECLSRGGYQSAYRLTDVIHFDPDHPEYHNIYISNIKNKFAMEYKNDQWYMVTKKELIDKIYRNKKEYVEENIEKFYGSLTDRQKKSLEEWLNTDEDDEDKDRVKKAKDDICLLLFNKRDMIKLTN